jgi:hypothetical protein
MSSLISIVKEYIDAMLGEMQGRKALIMDKDTLSKGLNITYFLNSDCFSGLLSHSNLTERSLLY